jgi:DNA helicase-2/ATP-dependent DNA helicase PcrA
MDELDQFLYLYRGDGHRALLDFARLELDIEKPDDLYLRIQSSFIPNPKYPSNFEATSHLVEFFNRVSEEAPLLADWREKAEALGLAPYHVGIRLLLDLYGVYVESLKSSRRVDLSLVQNAACQVVESSSSGASVFDEIIIDEYQDTNTVQERLVFGLAAGKHNLCVVGDDDQALYRFRGATVENFVRFPDRVRERWSLSAHTIPITRNYRSRGDIIRFYGAAIESEDWSAGDGNSPYRVSKRIESHRGHDGPAVFSCNKTPLEDVATRIASLVADLLASGKLDDPNRIAFLFPSVKGKAAAVYIAALESRGIKTYAPRAGSFLDTEEALLVLGLIGKTIGFARSGLMNTAFRNWTLRAEAAADSVILADPALALFIADRKVELDRSASDYALLLKVSEEHGWTLKAPYNLVAMKRFLTETPGISEKAQRSLRSRFFDSLVARRAAAGTPFTLEYVLARATGLDWSLLDHFYRLCAFEPLKGAFDLAQGLRGAVDEGPICNLSLVSGYIARFGDEYGELIGPELAGGLLARLFFSQYLSLLLKLGESEFEDPEDPFPRGRVSFLTIHQAKGLEFPVVVVPNTVRRARRRACDDLIEPFLGANREPPSRRPAFDEARRFYVAFSRAENLLIVPRSPYYCGKETEALLALAPDFISFDPAILPQAKIMGADLARNYSYTGDYTFYNQCPRRYMAFRKYGFAASRTQYAVFGTLVHRTIEDIHRKILDQREVDHA